MRRATGVQKHPSAAFCHLSGNVVNQTDLSTTLRFDSASAFEYSSILMEQDTNYNYLVWGSDNIAYGPVELPVLVSWIKLGRVIAESWVFKDADGTWSRASDLTELKVLFKSKQAP